MPVITTPFSDIYNSFLRKITDDMYMELSKEQTIPLLKELFLSAIIWFEFPRFDLYNFDAESENYNILLTKEEIEIISTYMIVEWLGQQLATVENVRMKYSGSDFKFTSQANHMAKIQSMKKEYQRIGFHLQRLYKRRMVCEDGRVHSTMDVIMAPLGYKHSHSSGSRDNITTVNSAIEIVRATAEAAEKAAADALKASAELKQAAATVNSNSERINSISEALVDNTKEMEKIKDSVTSIGTLDQRIAAINDAYDKTQGIKATADEIRNSVEQNNRVAKMLTRMVEDNNRHVDDMQNQLDKLPTDKDIDEKINDAIEALKNSKPSEKQHLLKMIQLLSESVD